MITGDFYKYLKNLGYSDEEIESNQSDRIFTYFIQEKSALSVQYILALTEKDIFDHHKILWNRNTDSVFIAVGKEQSYLVNIKEKPDAANPLKKNICIKSFEYGINSPDFIDVDIYEISKSNIDSAYLFDFVSKQPRRSRAVDTDLLLNLLTLKRDLISKTNEQIIHLLILRCLFLKYLEDRGIFKKDYLVSILKTNSPLSLINAFNEICKINGDVFRFEELEEKDLQSNYLEKLALFFETDYRSGQQFIFPYLFDQIPIQLISQVYEAFLKGSTKKGTGIYYTPPFLVNFILSQTLVEKAEKNPFSKVFDPAVGSGAFLVESFKILQRSRGSNISFADKKDILERQLFGMDIDKNALQIAAFSLYLALLETEDPAFIKNEIEHAHPILPNLIGKTLINGNTITDNQIFNDCYFDCIVSNPPWGAVSTETGGESFFEKQNKEEREAIDSKVLFPEYQVVSNYERSQAFLMRVSRWSNEATIIGMVVKNSIFLNDKSNEFRKQLLKTFHVKYFYELSHYDKILFRKNKIGEIGGEKIELGATEPCAVLIYGKDQNSDKSITYISPKLTPFAEYFDFIQYTPRDVSVIKQSEFLQTDTLWKVLVNGDQEDYDLIKKLNKFRQDIDLICGKGFEPQENNVEGIPVYLRKLIKSEHIHRYRIDNKSEYFNWNQRLRRPGNPELYSEERILIATRPKPSDNFHLRAIFIKEDAIFRNDILGLKFQQKRNIKGYLALLNSSLFGYFLFQNSVQWFGGSKRDALRKSDIINLPFLHLDNYEGVDTILKNKIEQIERGNLDVKEIEQQIDDIVFDLFELLDYEKEIIREFYQINVERANHQLCLVHPKDIQDYFNAFRQTFSLILSATNSLTASFNISPNLGAVICISIVADNQPAYLKRSADLQIVNFVKSRQLKKAEVLQVLNEEKIKIYEKDKFYIIKSNQFKDWTVRQAIKDAKDEIDQFIKHLAEADDYTK